MALLRDFVLCSSKKEKENTDDRSLVTRKADNTHIFYSKNDGRGSTRSRGHHIINDAFRGEVAR